MEQEITFYEELNTTQYTSQEEIIRKYAERIEEAEEEISITRRNIEDAFDTLKNGITRAAYNKGLEHGYNQARQHLEEEEREKSRKADKEIAEVCATLAIIVAIGLAVALILTGISFL